MDEHEEMDERRATNGDGGGNKGAFPSLSRDIALSGHASESGGFAVSGGAGRAGGRDVG